MPASAGHGVQTWDHHAIKNIYVSICLLNRSVLSVCVLSMHVCLCVCERESWRDKEKGREREICKE